MRECFFRQPFGVIPAQAGIWYVPGEDPRLRGDDIWSMRS